MKKSILFFLILIFATPSFATEPPLLDSYWTGYALSDKCPSDKPFLSEEVADWSHANPGQILNYKCVSCLEDHMQIEPGHEKDFEICTNRETMLDGRDLYSVKKCPADKPLRYRPVEDCMPCDTERWMGVPEAECAKCPNRKYVDGFCKLKEGK